MHSYEKYLWKFQSGICHPFILLIGMVLEDVFNRKNFLRSLFLKEKYVGVVYKCTSCSNFFGIHFWIGLFWNPNYYHPESTGGGVEWYLLRWGAEFEWLLQRRMWYFLSSLFKGIPEPSDVRWFLYLWEQNQCHSGRKHFHLSLRLQ